MVNLYYYSLLLTFLLVTITLIFIKRGAKPGPKLPPSPWKLPFIGNMHQLLGAPPHRIFRQLSLRYGPIMLLKLGQVDHLIISTPEAAREILKTHDLNFASRPHLIAPTIMFYGNRDVGFAPYGSYWRQLRKICVLELLSTSRVKSFRHIREAANSALIRSISTSFDKTTVNLSEKLLQLASTTTTCAVFGSECKHGTRFILEVKKAVVYMSGLNLGDFFPSLRRLLDCTIGTSAKLMRIRSNIDKILDEIITEHQKSRNNGKEKDLIDVLLRVMKGGEDGLDFSLSKTDIKSVILDMFTAGTDTSSTTLIWLMVELMRHPKVMEKAQNEVRQTVKGKCKETIEEADLGELHYLKLVVKETLRLHPPAPMLLPRVCRERCNVSGFEIPEETRVIINAWSIARDPRYWEDAESFSPERFEGSSIDFLGENFQYLPFGGGRRVCPGLVFGLATVELTLAQLLFHFDWELPDRMDPKDVDMTEAVGGTLSLKSDLHLIATRCSLLPNFAPC